MKSVVKIALGIVLACVILIGGCAALIAGGANEAQKDSDRTAITPAEYRQVRTGDARSEVEDRLGSPSDASEFSSEVDGLGKPVGSSCIYYGREGELIAGYQFCFDINTDRLESKSSF